MFADKGRALEQAINNLINNFNIPGLKTMIEVATEKDGMADLLLGLYIGDQKMGEFGVEIKLGTTNVRLTSNNITYDVNTNEATFTFKAAYPTAVLSL